MSLTEMEKEAIEKLGEGIKKQSANIYSIWTPFEVILKRRAIMSLKKDGGERFIQLVLAAVSRVEVVSSPAVVDRIGELFIGEIMKISSIKEKPSRQQQPEEEQQQQQGQPRGDSTRKLAIGGEAWCQIVKELSNTILQKAQIPPSTPYRDLVLCTEYAKIRYSHLLFLQRVLNADENVKEWLDLILVDYMQLISAPSVFFPSTSGEDQWDCFPRSKEALLKSCMHWITCQEEDIPCAEIHNNSNKEYCALPSEGDTLGSSTSVLFSRTSHVDIKDLLHLMDCEWPTPQYRLLLFVGRLIYELLLRRKSLEGRIQPSSTRTVLLGNALTSFTMDDKTVYKRILMCLEYVELRRKECKLEKTSEFVFLRVFSLVVCRTSLARHGIKESYKNLIEFLMTKYDLDHSVLGKLSWRLVAYGS